MGLYYLRPNSIVSNTGGWSGTFTDIDDEVPFVSPDANVMAKSTVGVSASAFTAGASPMRAALAIARITFHWQLSCGSGNVVWGGNFGGFGIGFPGLSFSGTNVGSASATVNPGTGKPFTVAELDAANFSCQVEDPTGGSAQNAHVHYFYVLVEFTPSPVADPVRKRATRSLRQSARPSQAVEISVPIQAGNVRMLGVLPVSHPDFPSSDGQGAGIEIHQRRPSIVLARRYDPAGYLFRMTALDMVPGAGFHSLYRSLRSKSPAAATLAGVARSDGGLSDQMLRNSRAWVKTVDGRIVGLGTDEFKTEKRGTLFEPALDNHLLRSSFVSGVTGLTAIGAAGQSTADTTDLLFAASETANSLKIARNATAEDQGRSWPATAAWSTNQKGVLSIDYKNDSGVAVYARLQRSSDGFYLNAAGAFVSGVQNIALPVKTTRSPENRYRSPVFDVGSGTPTLTLSIVHLSADASGTTSHVYHVQLDKGTWASSRKVNDASIVASANDLYTIKATRAPLGIPNERGTIFALVCADWNSADETGNHRILDLRFNNMASNREVVRYQNGQWLAGRQIPTGGDAIASLSGSVTRGTFYVVARRHVSDRGELGLARGTVSIFVNGVRGTDAATTPSAAGAQYSPVVSFPADLIVGASSQGGGQQEWGGSIAELLATPLVLDDDQIADFSARLLATAAG